MHKVHLFSLLLSFVSAAPLEDDVLSSLHKREPEAAPCVEHQSLKIKNPYPPGTSLDPRVVGVEPMPGKGDDHLEHAAVTPAPPKEKSGTPPQTKTVPAQSSSKVIPGGKSGKASTTLYKDPPGGACGCYNAQTQAYLPWQGQTSGTFYTAAGNEFFFDEQSGTHWCGSGCGKCYELTSTGSSGCEGCGKGAPAGKTITVMVTNLCPPSPHYCVPRGQTNQAGMQGHLDIYAAPESNWQIDSDTWDNPTVTYQEVECPNPYGSYYNEQCQCAKK